MTYNYIFCPLCGSTKWDKNNNNYSSASTQANRVELVSCGSCKKFKYSDNLEYTMSPAGIEYFQKTREYVQVTIKNYFIHVSYKEKFTEFSDRDTGRILLKLNSAITFNWYKKEDELCAKIKKYLVFS